MNLYKLNQVREIQHYQVPKTLFKHPFYKDLTNDTRLAYSILLDRLELSRKNNWANENNEVFIIYTRDEMAKELNIKSKTTITKVFKQLNEFELIKEERTGLNKPNKIYVAHLKPLPLDTEKPIKPLKYQENFGSTENGLQEVQEIYPGSTENGLQEVQKLNTNNTESNQTDFNKTNNNIDRLKIDRFSLLFNNNKDMSASVFEKTDDTKGISLAEYFLKEPTERDSSEIGLTEEQEDEFIKYLEKAEAYITPDCYDYFYMDSSIKFRQYAYLVMGAIYDILLSPHKRVLNKINRDKIIELLNRIDEYTENIEDIYAYFKASLIRELRK